VKKYAKETAISMGYPILEDNNGNPIRDFWGKVQGISEKDCSTNDAAILIEAIVVLASELNISLIER
jgi:hypothetical protein